jgi:hypothetical protein
MFTITLFKWTASFKGHTKNKLHGVLAKNRAILLQLGPDAICVVTKNNNLRLSLKGLEILFGLMVRMHIVSEGISSVLSVFGCFILVYI